MVIWCPTQHLKHLSDTFWLVIYFLKKKGKTIKLFTATSDRTSTEFKFTETVLLTSSSEDVFTNVVPADFNGDTQMDLFVTTQKLPASNTAVNGCVYWGSLSKGSILGKLQKNYLPTVAQMSHMFTFDESCLLATVFIVEVFIWSINLCYTYICNTYTCIEALIRLKFHWCF